MGGGATGGDLTKEFISSVGGLIEYLCSGVGTFDLFGRETGAKTKHGYTWHRLSCLWNGVGFGEGEFFYRYLSATS